VSGSNKKKAQKKVGMHSYIESIAIYTEQSPDIPIIQQSALIPFISTIIEAYRQLLSNTPE